MKKEKNMEAEESRASVCYFEDEEIILKEGELSDEMYKILSGSVIVYLHYGEKEEYVVGIFSKGRCFGEWNVLSDEPSGYTFVAYGKVLLLRITKDSLEDFIKNNPKNAIDIMHNMAQSMVMLQKNIDLFLEEKDYRDKKEELQKQKNDLKKKIMQYNIGGLQSYVAEYSVKI